MLYIYTCETIFAIYILVPHCTIRNKYRSLPFVNKCFRLVGGVRVHLESGSMSVDLD